MLKSNTVKPVMRGHLNKCPYMTGAPSSQVHFKFRRPDMCSLVTGFTVLAVYFFQHIETA